MMWSRLVLSSLLILGASAFAPAPIRWGGSVTERLILMPTSKSIPIVATELPQKLTVRDPQYEKAAGDIPRFTARPDDSIVWESEKLCIEASGTQSGSVVRLNHCTGGATQKWSWFPWGPMQLKGTNQCVDAVVDENGAVNGAPAVLRECEISASESWKFETPEKQKLDIKESHHADLFFNLAIVYWSGLSTALIISFFNKLCNKGTRVQSQPFVSGCHVAAAMAVELDAVACGNVFTRRATLPKMVAIGTTSRKAVEAIGWRSISSIVTAFASMLFAGSPATAAGIVGWDLCSNSAAMFIRHIRGKSTKCPLTNIWGNTIGPFNTLFASIVLTKGNVWAAIKITVAEIMIKPVLFLLYDRMWAPRLLRKLFPDSTTGNNDGTVAIDSPPVPDAS